MRSSTNYTLSAKIFKKKQTIDFPSFPYEFFKNSYNFVLQEIQRLIIIVQFATLITFFHVLKIFSKRNCLNWITLYPRQAKGKAMKRPEVDLRLYLLQRIRAECFSYFYFNLKTIENYICTLI